MPNKVAFFIGGKDANDNIVSNIDMVNKNLTFSRLSDNTADPSSQWHGNTVNFEKMAATINDAKYTMIFGQSSMLILNASNGSRISTSYITAYNSGNNMSIPCYNGSLISPSCHYFKMYSNKGKDTGGNAEGWSNTLTKTIVPFIKNIPFNYQQIACNSRFILLCGQFSTEWRSARVMAVGIS